MNNIYFKNLDGLRFIAFFAVFCFHIGYLLPLSQNSSALSILTHNLLFNQGENGVSFFFVLSSFLITYLLLEEKKGGGINIYFFYIRRIARIFPLYFLIIILGFFIIPYFFSKTSQPIVINENIYYYLAFIGNFDQLNLLSDGVQNNRIISVLWSLAVEEQFYLIWPITLFFTPLKKLPIVFFLLFFTSLIFKFYFKDYKWILYLHPLSILSDFTIGATIAYLCSNSQKFISFVKNISHSQNIIIYAIGIFCFIIDQLYPVIHKLRVFLPIFFGYVLIEQIYSNNSFYKISRLKFITYLGKLSYGLYLFHCIALVGIQFSFSNLFETKSLFHSLIIISSTFIITVLFSHLSFKYLESYFLSLKSKYRKQLL